MPLFADVKSLKIQVADDFLLREYFWRPEQERAEIDLKLKGLPEELREFVKKRIPEVENRLWREMLKGWNWQNLTSWWGGMWGERCSSHSVLKVCQYISKKDPKYDYLKVWFVKNRISDEHTPPNLWIKINGVHIGSQLLKMRIDPILKTDYQYSFEIWANSNEPYLKDLFRYARRENGRVVNAWELEMAFEHNGVWDSGNGNYQFRFEEETLWDLGSVLTNH